MDYTSFEEIQDLLSHKPGKKKQSQVSNSFGPLGLQKGSLKPTHSQAIPSIGGFNSSRLHAQNNGNGDERN